MAKLELTLTHNEVESIVRQWVQEHYSELDIKTITTLTGKKAEINMEFGDNIIPIFKGFKFHLDQKEGK